MKRMTLFASLLVFILVTVMVSYGVSSKDAVGVWLLDEGTGAVAKDSSGNGNDGTVEIATWANGKFGKALSFEGEASVAVPSTAKLNNGGQYTLMAYFNANVLNDWHQVIAKDNQYLLRIDPPSEGGKLSSFVNLAGGWEPRASAIVPEVNKWYHYTATYDSSTKKLTVFVDGVKAGESDREGEPTANDNPVTFGHWGGGSRFRGLLDEIAIFSVALSEADIKTIADNGLSSALALGGTSSVTPASKLATTWGDVKQP
ncbi:MAG: LamG protein [Candidatus Poribacteria bacterium]|nr:LamG protein [Candidatus Poribacteria bacterium]